VDRLWLRTSSIYTVSFISTLVGQTVTTFTVLIFEGGNVRHAFNAGLLTFAVISSTTFLACAHELNQKYDMIKKAFSQRKFKELKRDDISEKPK
jgi:hypothetical protein